MPYIQGTTIHHDEGTDLSVNLSEECLKRFSDIFPCFSTHLVKVSDVVMVSKL